MKIIFMGTPDFASASLEKLIASGHEILAVYTQPDRPSGRGKKLAYSAVKQVALAHDLPVYQPEKVRSEQTIAELQALQPEVIIVVAYGQILPQAILDIPRYGCLNVHGSILPKYRGAAPIHWAILNGDTVTGVTVMKMDVGMDTGDILSVAEEQITPVDTTESLYNRLKLLGAELLVTTLKELEQGKIVARKQDDAVATYTKLITRDMEKIDWQNSAVSIHNKIRALSGVYTVDSKGETLKIWRSSISEYKDTKLPVGSVVQLNKAGFIVQTGSQTLQIEEVQPANRKRMAAKDFANGRKLEIGEQFF